jgi:hypothetical protein
MRYSFSQNCIVPFIYGMLVSFDILHCEILTSSNENIEIQQFLDVSYKNVHIICKSTLPLRWPSVALSGSGQVRSGQVRWVITEMDYQGCGEY